jgi:hypothetical protein
LKFLILLTFLFPLVSQGADLLSSSSGSGGGGGSRSLSFGGFKPRLIGGAKFSRATMMTKNDLVEKRSLNGIGAEAIAGFNFGPLIVGGGASYTKFYQSTDKEDVSDTDTSGDLISYQGVLGLAFGKLCLLGRYYFKADYKLSQKTSAEETATYTTPDGSYGVSLMYRPGGRSFWSLDYQNINFTEAEIGSTTTDVSAADEQINLNSFGITYGFMF